VTVPVALVDVSANVTLKPVTVTGPAITTGIKTGVPGLVGVGVVTIGAKGVTPLETDDGIPVPKELVAVTVKVYTIPFVSPVIITGLDVPIDVTPPGDPVTVYEVIVLPPLETGAVKVTVACPLPAVATTSKGAPGAAVFTPVGAFTFRIRLL